MAEDITAAPVPIQVGGKQWLFSPFDDYDYTALDNWVRQQFIETSKQSISKNATRAERDEELEVVFRVAAGLSAFSGTGAKIMATIDGMSRLLFQALIKCHPDQTFESVRAMMFKGGQNENLKRVNAAFKDANIPDISKLPKGSKKGATNRPAK